MGIGIGTAARQRDIARCAEVGKERVVLEHESYAPLLRRPVDPIIGIEPDLVADGDASGRAARQSGNHAQDRRLAAARRTDERDQFTGLAGELGVQRNRCRLLQPNRDPGHQRSSSARLLRWPVAKTIDSATSVNATSSSDIRLAPALSNACTRS